MIPVSYGIVLPTGYGPVIANRYDTDIQIEALIRTGYAYNHRDIKVLCALLRSAPEGSVCLDVGANIGLYALPFAKTLESRAGCVHAFEAQRVLAYMAAGTAALNGVENLFVHHKAVGAERGRIPIPKFDYNKKAHFGGMEFGDKQREFLGQARQQPEKQEYVEMITLDSLELDNVHLIKIDIEGMEEAALEGARKLIARDMPVLCVEWIKSDRQKLVQFCKNADYRVFEWGMDLLCVHPGKQDGYSINWKDIKLKVL